MPPNTLEVMRHRAGFALRSHPERAAGVAKHDLSLVGVHDVEVAVDRALEMDEEVGHLFG